MFERLLTVKYITSKNCFLTLSINNFKHLEANSISLTYKDNKKAYASVNSSNQIDDNSIGISSLYAKVLDIDENFAVNVCSIPKPPTVNQVTVTAINENDHYVLEALATTVQSTLLQQIHVLFVGQLFAAWIGSTISVTVRVCDIKPISPGTIDNLTEVVIKPPSDKFSIDNKSPEKELPQKEHNEEINIDIFAEYKNKNNDVILRVVPFKYMIEQIGKLCHPYNVFVSKNSLPNNLKDTLSNFYIYSLKLVLNQATPLENKLVYVRLYVIEDFFNDYKFIPISSENLFVSDVLMDFLNCDIGSRIMLQPFESSIPEVKEIEIYTKRNFSVNITETFQQYLADNCQFQAFILNQNIVFNVNNVKCFVRFYPVEAQFCVVNSDFVRNCKLFVVNETIPPKEALENDDFSKEKYCTKITNYSEIIETSIFLILLDVEVYSSMNNVLITGKRGTGKTTLLNYIKNCLVLYPHFIFTKKINCKAIKGKTVESLHKLFEETLIDLVHHQPSLLIVDDLHILCENVSDNEINAQSTVYFNRVSEMLESIFKTYCRHNAVGILASATSTTKLNKYIYAARGNHLFKSVFNIAELSRKDRKELLKFLFANFEYDSVDLEDLAQKTESFVLQDMVDFADKTLFESYQEDCHQNVITITPEHCKNALDSVILTSLEGVKLHSPGDKDLNDIGGLEEAKSILIETLLWPSKYPELFMNAPLRLPSGLLLYGPPGTGKTILAGAAAKHCGLRLISIKGPELLSKYIGASEQAVRDVFLRAQSAKPCILFFDEFDSLAPRRGHDNTGVTDRVVNQFLTQLDGIETLQGVFILAATSRPDLLDPALLRPGRLDRHVRCRLPDKASRLEILKVLSKNLDLSADVDLDQLAGASEGFSGADLQAVLYTAQLESVKHLLQDEENMQEFQSKIGQAQLMEALKNTRPSLNKAEQARYEQIYQRFEGGTSSDFTPGSRATLA